MVGITSMLSIALAVLLGLAFTPGSDTYETRVNHSPWRAYETDLNSVENSYQYYHPYNQRQGQQQRNYNKKGNYYGWNYPTRDQAKKKKVNSNRWKYPSSTNSYFGKDKKKNMFDDWNNYLPNIDMNKIKMPNFPSVRKFTTTKRPVQKPGLTTREWPAYHVLPPIRMIKLPMDEPPQLSRRG